MSYEKMHANEKKNNQQQKNKHTHTRAWSMVNHQQTYLLDAFYQRTNCIEFLHSFWTDINSNEKAANMKQIIKDEEKRQRNKMRRM